MDSLNASQNGLETSSRWTTLFRHCYQRRYRPDLLDGAFRELAQEERIEGVNLAKIILLSAVQIPDGVDPLLPQYLECMLNLALVDTCDVLVALLLLSQYRLKPRNHVDFHNDWINVSAVTQESVLALLAGSFADGTKVKSFQASRRSCRALVYWLKACNTYDTMSQIHTEGGLQAPEPGLVLVFQALGTFAVMLLSNASVKTHLSSRWVEAEKTAFVSALEHFASTLSQWSASPISARLQILLRTPPLAIANGDGIPNFTFADISAFFTDLPIVTTRAGLYILLNASLTARPVLDDFVILSHLRARYPSDTQAMLVDLVIASFDALANALHRRDTSHVVLCYRSFIANKVPLLLTSLSVELFPPLTAQYCIQVALGRISIQPFPPLSSDNDGDAINRVLRDCQRDFLSACQMHHLIGEASIPGHSIPSSSLPRRHIKANLIAQCVGSISRAEILIAELDNMHGNTGPISSALVETLQHLCDTKETMSLRTLCNALSRQIALVDIVLQHASLNSFLLPLCGLLNEWTHDEDQSEFQPPYEEFAAILLLVLALVYRYDISTMDLEFIGIHGYVPKLLSGLSKSIPVEDLTHDQDQQLKKWIEGLYATDDQGETTGIGDETMSQCPPQAFYLLVPTLFEQSVQACSANYLALNTLKGGLEFLLEPFLLPSLVGGLRWLINHSWQDRGDTEILLQVLQKLLLPTSISGDAQSMHRTILAIVAAPLAHSLQALSKRMPNRGDIGALIEVLAPYSNSQRSLKSTRAELQKWTSRPDGGIRRNVTELVDGLIVWSLQADINPVPKSYTHRMLAAAIMMLGVDAVLDAIVEAVQRGASPAALEVGTALICAPMSIGLAPATSMSFDGGGPGFSGQRRSLRQALRLLLDDTKYILEQENEGGQTLIRLGRLVEAQSAVSQVPLTMPLSNIGTQELMQSIDMTGVDLSGTQLMQPPGDLPDVSTADFAAVMSQSMDMSAATVDMNAMNDVNALQMDLSDNLFATSTDLNLGLDPTQEENADVQAFNRQTENVAQSTNDDDIFAGLDLGEMGMGDDEFNF